MIRALHSVGLAATLIMVGALAGCPACRAQAMGFDQAWQACSGDVAADQRVAACSVVIDAYRQRKAPAGVSPVAMSTIFANRAYGYNQKRMYKEVIDDAGQAITLNGENVAAYTNRGLARAALDDLEGAESDYREALRLDPGNEAAKASLAANQDAQRDRAARAEAAKAEQAQRDAERAYQQAKDLCFGESTSDEQRLQGCTVVIEARKEPADLLARAHNARGNVHSRAGRYLPAIADFDEAIRLDPGFDPPYGGRCWARASTDALDEALKECTAAVERRPREAALLGALALVYLKLGDRATNLHQYDWIFGIDRKRDLYRVALGRYDAALQIEPGPNFQTYGRGVVRRRLGDAVQGDADIAEVERRMPGIAREAERRGVRP